MPLLQLLDDGQLTDSIGRKVNFKNCIVIMTSNIGIKRLQEFGTGVGFSTKSLSATKDAKKSEFLNKELKKHFGIDENHYIQAATLTDRFTHDDEVVDDLLCELLVAKATSFDSC